MDAMLASLASAPLHAARFAGPLAGWFDGRWGGGWHGGPAGGGGWWWIAWPLGWLAVLALLGVVTWLLVRAARRGGPDAASATAEPVASARRILAERYARGEIDEEEYRARLERLA